MNAYQAKRAEQRARNHIKSAGAMQLHRIVDLEADDYCAQEGGYVAPAPAPRIPRDRPPAAGAVYWFVVAWALVAFCIFVGWHVLATWGQQ